MALLNRHLLSEAVPLVRARFSPLCIKGTCGGKNMSKIFRTKPHSPRTDPHVEQVGRGTACVKAHDRFAAHKTRP
jgi:hypothetical protein